MSRNEGMSRNDTGFEEDHGLFRSSFHRARLITSFRSSLMRQTLLLYHFYFTTNDGDVMHTLALNTRLTCPSNQTVKTMMMYMPSRMLDKIDLVDTTMIPLFTYYRHS